MITDSRALKRLAVLGGFLKPEESSHLGGVRAAYLATAGIAKWPGGIASVDSFHDVLRLRTLSQVRLSIPNDGLPVRVLPQREILSLSGEYDVIFAPETEHELYLPHALRPLGDRAPVVCDIGTSYSATQWLHLFAGACSRAIESHDVFILKSHAAERLFRRIWLRWMSQFGIEQSPVTVVMPQAIDLAENSRNEGLGKAVRAQLAIPSDSCVVLTFSRLNAGSKGDHRAVVALWRDILAQMPNATLVLAGVGGARQFVESLHTEVRGSGAAASIVVLPNPYDLWPNARTALMSASDVLLHLSTGIEEVAPLVVCEAMAHGTVPIVADWSGMPEQVEHGRTGLVVPTITAPLPEDLIYGNAMGFDPAYNTELARCVACDPSSTIAAIVSLVADPNRRRDLAANAVSFARRTFGWERVTAQRLEVFEMAHRRSMSETRQIRSRAPVVDVSDVMSALGGTFLTGTTRVALLSGERARRLPEWHDPETHEVWETLLDGMSPDVLVNLTDWLRSVHERLGGAGQSQLPGADLIELYGRFACRLFAYGAITLRQESDSLSVERAHAAVPNVSAAEAPRLNCQGDPA